MIKIKILLVLFVSACIVSQGPSVLADDELLPEKSPAYKELMEVAVKWKYAVLKKDIEALLHYALPGAKKNIASLLKDKNSELYRIFFEGKTSFYEILRKAKRLKVVMVTHKSLEEYRKGVTIYFYDQDTVRVVFPLALDEAQRFIDKGEIISVFFFMVEGQWFTSFEFSG